MISFNGKDIDLYLEYGYSTVLEKNETTTMFFLKKPSLGYKVYFVKVYFVIGIYGCQVQYHKKSPY